MWTAYLVGFILVALILKLASKIVKSENNTWGMAFISSLVISLIGILLDMFNVGATTPAGIILFVVELVLIYLAIKFIYGTSWLKALAMLALTIIILLIIAVVVGVIGMVVVGVIGGIPSLGGGSQLAIPPADGSSSSGRPSSSMAYWRTSIPLGVNALKVTSSESGTDVTIILRSNSIETFTISSVSLSSNELKGRSTESATLMAGSTAEYEVSIPGLVYNPGDTFSLGLEVTYVDPVTGEEVIFNGDNNLLEGTVANIN